jgi:hypothetical protein
MKNCDDLLTWGECPQAKKAELLELGTSGSAREKGEEGEKRKA